MMFKQMMHLSAIVAVLPSLLPAQPAWPVLLPIYAFQSWPSLLLLLSVTGDRVVLKAFSCQLVFLASTRPGMGHDIIPWVEDGQAGGLGRNWDVRRYSRGARQVKSFLAFKISSL
jgi:hypothetical protein